MNNKNFPNNSSRFSQFLKSNPSRNFLSNLTSMGAFSKSFCLTNAFFYKEIKNQACFLLKASSSDEVVKSQLNGVPPILTRETKGENAPKFALKKTTSYKPQNKEGFKSNGFKSEGLKVKRVLSLSQILGRIRQKRQKKLDQQKRQKPIKPIIPPKSLIIVLKDKPEKAVYNRRIIDYKHCGLLQRYIGLGGKILPRRQTRLTAKQQRYVAKTIKSARIMGLLPFVSKERGFFR